MRTNMPVTFTILTGIALLGIAYAGSGATPAPNDPAKAVAAAVKSIYVTIDNFSFTPGVLTVSPGTQVTWTNHDDVPHTVVSTGGYFKSRALDTDEMFSFTFRAKGTYPYFCSVHPMMTAKVIVK